MLRNTIFIAVILLSGLSGLISAQTDAALKPSVISGEVASITDATIVINSKTGAVEAVLSAKTVFMRVPPDNPVLKAAVPAAIADIGVGDKLMVTGLLAADGKSVPARSVYLMTKSELSQKKAKEAEEWKTRGISGKVTVVNAQTNQITVEMGGFMAKTSVTLTPRSDAKMLRYAPDSIRFADAKPSTMAEIKTGDEIRALGEKSSDGTAFSAETVLTGGFRQSAGRVKSIDIANKRVVVEDLNTKKDVTIAFENAVMMKRFPEEMATRMASMQAGGGAMGGPGGGVMAVRPPGGAPPAGGVQPVGGAQTAGPRPMSGGRPNLGEMIDRLPNMPAEDLKVGETIAVLTSSAIAGADHVNAIKLVAGVDPFIKMAEVSQAASGGRGGGAPNFNIPGLDGIGFP